MGLFLSYSTRDRADIDELLSALHRAHEDVWFDEDLGGGQVWWQKILERIRDCDVFVFAMSENSLDSKPCLAELGYAQSLGKPVLPIQIGQVGSMRVTPLAAVEVIDFQHPTVETGIRLITGVQEARERATPLPSPLPDEPPVPFAYLMRLAAGVAQANLDPQEQADLIGQMRDAVHDDGGDPTTRGDIVQLLHTLRDRPDATDETRAEVAALLRTLGGSSHPVTHSGTGRSRKWLIAIAAAVVCALAAVAIVIFTRGKPAPSTAGPAATGSATVSTDASNSAPVVPPEKLESILLSANEIGAIMGAPSMTAEPVENGASDAAANFSDEDCIGADIVAATQAYKNSGYMQARSQSLTAPTPGDPGTPLSFVEQAAVSFPSAEHATTFLNDSEKRWRGCRGRVVQQTSDRGSFAWTYLDVARNGNTMSQVSTQEGGDGWDCEHTLTAHSSLILEAVACARNIQNNEANRIVARMVEKADA